MVGVTGSTQIASGAYHACVLTVGVAVECWGYNADGQLGDASNTDANVPVDVIGITGVTQITSGYYHSCALVPSGAVTGWGNNDFGQLGDGTNTASNVPVAMSTGA